MEAHKFVLNMLIIFFFKSKLDDEFGPSIWHSFYALIGMVGMYLIAFFILFLIRSLDVWMGWV